MASHQGKQAVQATDFEAAAWVERGSARLKEMSAHGKRVRLVEFLPGFDDPNWCAKGHVVFVLEGAVESRYQDGVTPRHAGEAYIIPPGIPHRSRNPHRVPARLLIVDDIVLAESASAEAG